LDARENVVEKYKNNLERYKDNVKYYEKEVKALEDLRAEKGELSAYQTEHLKDMKKSLAVNKKSIEHIKAQIEFNNIDFEGKDSAASIASKKEALQKELEKLNEIEQQKVEEYSVEYNEERRNLKSIDDIMKDFEGETNKLYEDTDSTASVDIPGFLNKQTKADTGNKDFDLNPVYESVAKGIKGKDLINLVPNEVADRIREYAQDYDFVDMENGSETNYGLHSGNKKKIELNLKAIGNNPYRFVETITHELRHARQHKIVKSILAKPKNSWTLEERIFVAKYNLCKKANRDRRRFYNVNKKLIDEYKYNNFFQQKKGNMQYRNSLKISKVS